MFNSTFAEAKAETEKSIAAHKAANGGERLQIRVILNSPRKNRARTFQRRPVF